MIAPASFDVICAGDAAWNIDDDAAREHRVRVKPGTSAVKVASALARGGLRVGIAMALADDRWSRTLVARLDAAGVQTSAVSLTPAPPTLVLVRGVATGEIVPHRPADAQAGFTIPAHWSAPVLFLSGLTPIVPHAAALCKAARAARRVGSLVVVDVDARFHLWAGQDGRAIRSVLREADVVLCDDDDLTALSFDTTNMRAAMRDDAVLIVARPPVPDAPRAPPLAARISAALARTGEARHQSEAFWADLLRGRGQIVPRDQRRKT